MQSTLERRPGGLRIARPRHDEAAAAPPASLAAACATICRACLAEQPALASTGARAALAAAAPGTAQHDLLRELGQMRPASASPIDPSRLWILRRFDGSLIGLYRLGEGGRVGLYPHPNESRWSQAGGRLRLQDPAGRVTTDFQLQGVTPDGRSVFAGLFVDGQTLHVLSEVGCDYAQLAMLDPELATSIAGLGLADRFKDPGLPPRPAVVLAAPRTGSHLLLNLLNSTGQVFIDAEILNFGKISIFGHDLPRDRHPALDLLRGTDPVRFAKVMLARSHHADGRMLDTVAVRGFKLFPQHSPQVLDYVIDEPALRIVHLHRANLLAEYSSNLVAFERGHWVGGPAGLKQSKSPFDAGRFMRFVEMKQRYLAHIRARLAQRAGASTEIEYSAFSRASLNGLLEFLLGQAGDDASFSHLGLKQQLNATVIERFENPREVQACLRTLGHDEWAGSEAGEVREF